MSFLLKPHISQYIAYLDIDFLYIPLFFCLNVSDVKESFYGNNLRKRLNRFNDNILKEVLKNEIF